MKYVNGIVVGVKKKEVNKMGLYVDWWYIPMSECEISFCPLITVWNIMPFVLLILIGIGIGYSIKKKEVGNS